MVEGVHKDTSNIVSKYRTSGMKNLKLFINIFISVMHLVSKKNDSFQSKTVLQRDIEYMTCNSGGNITGNHILHS